MSWENYEEAAARGPVPLLLKFGGLFLAVLIVIGIAGYILGWFGSAAQVAKDEFGPKAALQKYEWFIDQANAIDKMDQDIALFESRRADVERKYQSYGSNPTNWPVDVRVTYNRESQTARDDLLAVVSQRNNLVKEYNSQSEKFNWAPFQTNPGKPKERYFEYSVK